MGIPAKGQNHVNILILQCESWFKTRTRIFKFKAGKAKPQRLSPLGFADNLRTLTPSNRYFTFKVMSIVFGRIKSRLKWRGDRRCIYPLRVCPVPWLFFSSAMRPAWPLSTNIPCATSSSIPAGLSASPPTFYTPGVQNHLRARCRRNTLHHFALNNAVRYPDQHQGNKFLIRSGYVLLG